MGRFTFLLVIFSLLLSGCGGTKNELPVCDTRIPLSASFLDHPEFASLQYHKQGQYTFDEQKGYDMWADSKFEFNSGLQFIFVPKIQHVTDTFCVNGLLLQLKLPLNANQMTMLSLFNQIISTHTGLDANQMKQKLNKLLFAKDKFRLIAEKNGAQVNAGLVHHQYRGDFFIVEMEIQRY